MNRYCHAFIFLEEDEKSIEISSQWTTSLFCHIDMGFRMAIIGWNVHSSLSDCLSQLFVIACLHAWFFTIYFFIITFSYTQWSFSNSIASYSSSHLETKEELQLLKTLFVNKKQFTHFESLRDILPSLTIQTKSLLRALTLHRYESNAIVKLLKLFSLITYINSQNSILQHMTVFYLILVYQCKQLKNSDFAYSKQEYQNQNNLTYG